MNNQLDLRIKDIMASLFKVPAVNITPETSVDNVEDWDSLNHMKLVMALEEAYSIEFTEQEVTELLSLELVLMTLRSKGVQ